MIKKIIEIFTTLKNKTMAKTTGKGKTENTENPEVEKKAETPELSLKEKKNEILKFLAGKNHAEYTPEELIEKHFADKIHYYETRQVLPYLVNEGHLEYTPFQCSYKLTFGGREFLEAGGYK
mgnify:CR=1 FL=1